MLHCSTQSGRKILSAAADGLPGRNSQRPVGNPIRYQSAVMPSGSIRGVTGARDKKTLRLIESTGIVGECVISESSKKPFGVRDCKKSQYQDQVQKSTKITCESGDEHEESSQKKPSTTPQPGGKSVGPTRWQSKRSFFEVPSVCTKWTLYPYEKSRHPDATFVSDVFSDRAKYRVLV